MRKGQRVSRPASPPVHPVVAAVPVKPFGIAKRRLSEVLSPEERRWLGEELARRTVETIAAANVTPLVLSADDHVTEWARRSGIDVLLDEGSSLDQAATTALAHVLGQGLGWMIIHADLPVLGADDVLAAAKLIESGRSVIAPSSDGGTSAIGSADPIGFAYGPGSFHRHLAVLRDPVVVTGIGWALDLDTSSDLEAARRHPRGAWLLNPTPRRV